MKVRVQYTADIGEYDRHVIAVAEGVDGLADRETVKRYLEREGLMHLQLADCDCDDCEFQI